MVVAVASTEVVVVTAAGTGNRPQTVALWWNGTKDGWQHALPAVFIVGEML